MARKVNGTKSAEWRANVGSMARPFKNGDVDSGPRLPDRGRVDVGRRNTCKVFRNARSAVTGRCNLSRFLTELMGAHAAGVQSIVHAGGVRTYAGVAQRGGGASLRN